MSATATATAGPSRRRFGRSQTASPRAAPAASGPPDPRVRARARAGTRRMMRDQHGHHAHDVGGEERRVVGEVGNEGGQEAGGDGGPAADERVGEHEHQHRHERVERVLHELRRRRGRGPPAGRTRRAGASTREGGRGARCPRGRRRATKTSAVTAQDGGGALVVALHHPRARLLLRLEGRGEVHRVEGPHGEGDHEHRRPSRPGDGARRRRAAQKPARDRGRGRDALTRGKVAQSGRPCQRRKRRGNNDGAAARPLGPLPPLPCAAAAMSTLPSPARCRCRARPHPGADRMTADFLRAVRGWPSSAARCCP